MSNNPAVERLAMSQLTPIGFHTSSCGYCRSNSRREKKIQSKHGQDDNNTFAAHVEEADDEELASSQSPSTSKLSLRSRASYYVRALQLQPVDYQVLLNHGWRRSGTLLYKPEMRRSCCPHYTIRLPVEDLHVRKDQRSACNRWNKFVLGEDYVKESARLHPKSRAEKKQQRNSFDLEEAIHGAEASRLPAEPVPAHRFEVNEESSVYSEEKYELYVNYQSAVHGEPPSKSDKSGFKRFLCDSPLVSKTESIDGRQRSYASVHQCYRLDGRLIAMAVLDLLPDGVSAVYFMYHSDYEQWSFGKLSALREASFARENGYKFYYMGYYINSCGKMRYKNDFQPQYFLDLIDKSWIRLDTTAQEHMTKLGFYSPAELASDSGRVVVQRSDAMPEVTDGENDHQSRAAELVAEMEADVNEERKSLFELGFAGMQSLDDVRPLLDNVGIRLPGGGTCRGKDLVKWHEWDEHNPKTIKGIIAELLACIGPGINERILVNFG